MENIRICSGVIIYRYLPECGEFAVLLVKTRNFRNKTGEYLYTIVGGRIEPKDYGDTREERAWNCAVRESKEEVSLGIRNPVYVRMSVAFGREIAYKDPNTIFEFYTFTAEAVGQLDDLEIILKNDEITYAGYHRQHELDTLPMEPRLRQLINTVYKNPKKYFQK